MRSEQRGKILLYSLDPIVICAIGRYLPSRGIVQTSVQRSIGALILLRAQLGTVASLPAKALQEQNEVYRGVSHNLGPSLELGGSGHAAAKIG